MSDLRPIGSGAQLPSIEELLPAARERASGSTSAQLRQTQTALAASQADLTRVEQERDELADEVRVLCRSEALEVVRLTGQRDLARAELDRLRAATGWIVARDGGRDCIACHAEITRGEAYELLGVDELKHIHCPAAPEESTDA